MRILFEHDDPAYRYCTQERLVETCRSNTVLGQETGTIRRR
jgi:hypothetical protein